MQSSNSVENYIKGIYNLSNDNRDWVSTKDLADKMNIKPSSVTDMAQKLSSRKLVSYQKYKGVHLTNQGNKLALKVIRKHRLWEVFLHQTLGFSWDEVHEIAEQLEHIASPELVKRLDKFLNYPKFDPHGDPIPDIDGKIKAAKRVLMSDCSIHDEGQLVGVNDSSTSFLQFLESKQLILGINLKIKDKHEFDQSMDIELIDINQILNVSHSVASNLFLVKDK